MPNEVLLKSGTAVVWKNTGGTYALSFGGLAISAGRQGVKGDLGATRAARYLARITVNPNVAPTPGQTVDVYWAGSPDLAAGDANPGGTTGLDAAFSDTDLLKQLEFIGSISLDGATGNQTADVGILIPKHRYGMPVVFNASDQALNATEGDQAVTLYPVIDEVQ